MLLIIKLTNKRQNHTIKIEKKTTKYGFVIEFKNYITKYLKSFQPETINLDLCTDNTDLFEF